MVIRGKEQPTIFSNMRVREIYNAHYSIYLYTYIHINSGTLDFSEFAEMMSDLKAEKQIVEKRGANYSLPPTLAQHFTQQQIAELKVHFGECAIKVLLSLLLLFIYLFSRKTCPCLFYCFSLICLKLMMFLVSEN
jgi:hypothetical protein